MTTEAQIMQARDEAICKHGHTPDEVHLYLGMNEWYNLLAEINQKLWVRTPNQCVQPEYAGMKIFRVIANDHLHVSIVS